MTTKTKTPKTVPTKTAAPKTKVAKTNIKNGRKEKSPGLSRARAMARKHGFHVRTLRDGTGFRLITDRTLTEGNVETLISYMKGLQPDVPEAAPEAQDTAQA